MYSLCSLEVFEDYQCHIQKKFGDTFSWGRFYFPQYQQNFIVFYCIFHTFSHFFLAAQDRLLNISRGSLLFTWEICQKTTIFFFFSSFWGTFFWVSIFFFERYHFQSGCDPAYLQNLFTKQAIKFCFFMLKNEPIVDVKIFDLNNIIFFLRFECGLAYSPRLCCKKMESLPSTAEVTPSSNTPICFSYSYTEM